ncbi:MAG: hypothetical protein EXS52_01480 [Candidatus Staskawiczbacteria bacterium]|nr:hypothetical protein [Candidatus Staskawiczbacteria bacterium]
MNESLPTPEDNETEKKLFFDRIYKEALTKEGNFIEFEGYYSKKEFLDYVVRNYNVILHGSNKKDIEELGPRQANCKSKKFGNMIGVYATEDDVLPMFYAIQDTEKFQGVAISGYSQTTREDGTTGKKYEFKVNSYVAKLKPWSEGVIYILPKDSFEQGTDDEGKLIDEWMSKTAVRPVAKLTLKPEEFPYINNIETISEKD